MKRRNIGIFLFLLMSLSSKGFSTEKPIFVNMVDDSELRKVLVDNSTLKDPFSVQFRKTQTLQKSDEKGAITLRLWCGQLNAKNSAGGYTGWKDFAAYVSPPNTFSLTIDEGDEQAKLLARVLIDMSCEGSLIK